MRTEVIVVGAGPAGLAAAEATARAGIATQIIERAAAVGVRCCGDDGEDEQHAQLVIDASGYASCVAKPAGLQAGFDLFGLGAEQEFYGPGFDEREAWLLVGDAVAPGGYGWAFPDG